MPEPIGCLTFEKALEFTHRWSSPTAYEDDALLGLWTAAAQIGRCRTIVEVGCEYGRSTSLLAQIAVVAGHRLHLVDPFVDARSAPSLVTMLRELDIPFTLYCMTTEAVCWTPPIAASGRPHLVHIDGDHSKESLSFDCSVLLNIVDAGGFACFHDYAHPTLPDVKPTVDLWTPDCSWELVGDFGTCHVVRRK